MRYLKSVVGVAVIVLAFSVTNAFGCFCGGGGAPCEDYGKAAAVFVGPGSGTTVIVRAPMAGIVITRKAAEGVAVQRGAEPLVEIGNPTALWVVADVFERDLPLVRQGAAARVELPSIETTLDGRVASIGTVVSTGGILISSGVHYGFVADSGWRHIETAIDHRKSLGIVKAAEIVLLEELPIAPGDEPCAYHQGEEKARDDIAVATERSRKARFY